MNKLVLITLLVAIVSVAAHTPLPNSDRSLLPDMKDYINSVQNSWVAGDLPDQFKGLTLAQIKAKFLGARPSYSQHHTDPSKPITHDENNRTNVIPTSFNSELQWPGCIHGVRDQGSCGSCYAFAAAGVLSDRVCIATNKRVNLVLSPQYLVSCDQFGYGCNGGYIDATWRFIVKNGLPTDSCYPYSSSDGNAGQCQAPRCQDGSTWKTYKAINPVALYTPANIQLEILARGPVEAGFLVYGDFFNYRSGIYKHTAGSYMGGHAVKIIGWGRQGSTDYWIAHNSWGTTWGERGLFRIAFGECGIDSGAMAAQVDPRITFKSKISPRWN